MGYLSLVNRRGENLSKTSDSYLPERSVALTLFFSPWRQGSAFHLSSNALPGAAELDLPPLAGKGTGRTLRSSLGPDCSTNASQYFIFTNNCESTEENAIFICVEILCRRKRNPLWPLAAQLSAPCSLDIKPWCDKNTGNRSLHPPPRDGKVVVSVCPYSLSIPVSIWGSNKRPRSWKPQQMWNAFTSVNFINCFCFGGPEKHLSFSVEKILTELWVAMDAAFGLLQTLSLTVQDLILSSLLGL